MTIEELPDRPTARVRWWDAPLNRWFSRSLDMPPRDTEGRSSISHRLTLITRANAVVAAAQTTPPPSAPDAAISAGQATLGAALDLAVDDVLGKRHGDHSAQPAEWRRALEEARAVFDMARPMRTLGGIDALLLASSVLLRMAAGLSVAEWKVLLDGMRARVGRAQLTVTDLIGAYQRVARPAADVGSAVWTQRAVDLIRTMLVYSAKLVPHEFGAAAQFVPLSDLRDRLKKLAADLDITLSDSVSQGRPRLEHARSVMVYLNDPRQRIHSLLALAVTERATGRVRRSHLSASDDGIVRLRPTRLDGSVPTNSKGSLAGWRPMPCQASSALLLSMIRQWYPEEEAAFLTDPVANDYLLLPDHTWDGQTLTQSSGTTWRAIDSRLRLLLVLGIEGRITQYHRLTARDVQLSEQGQFVVRSQELKANKGMSDMYLADSQAEWLTFEMHVGYLREAHAARRAGQIDDYALFPPDEMVRGRVPLERFKPAPEDDSTLAAWNAELLEILGIPKPPRTNLRVWRRLFVDLYRAWRIPPDVQEVITGHDPVRIRGTVAQDHERAVDRDSSVRVYLDPSAHHLLVLAAQVMEHARTTYAATGAKCPTLT